MFYSTLVKVINRCNSQESINIKTEDLNTKLGMKRGSKTVDTYEIESRNENACGDGKN